MIQILKQPVIQVDEEPLLDVTMPRVSRRPSPPPFLKGNRPVGELLCQAERALKQNQMPAFSHAYNQLTAAYQPAIQWAQSCWDFLLSTEGIRFTPRSMLEKQTHRSDYRIFTEKEFLRLIHRAFRNALLTGLQEKRSSNFTVHLQNRFWPQLLELYRELRKPVDRRHRWLTPYSYLRCVPYRFFHPFHQQLVTQVVKSTPKQERRILELYYLRFHTEAAVAEEAGLLPEAAHRHRLGAMHRVARQDPLTHALLNQIERY